MKKLIAVVASFFCAFANVHCNEWNSGWITTSEDGSAQNSSDDDFLFPKNKKNIPYFLEFSNLPFNFSEFSNPLIVTMITNRWGGTIFPSCNNKSNENKEGVKGREGRDNREGEENKDHNTQLQMDNEFHRVAKLLVTESSIGDQDWGKLDNESLSALSNWSKSNITRHISGITTLFYPFGGPDITFALRFFPQMKTYILVGLEPIGNFADMQKNVKNKNAILSLKAAFSSYLKRGYFITSEMMTQLSNRNIRGTIYPLLVELVKNGCTILNVEDFSINPEGNEVPRQTGMPDCIKITFIKSDRSIDSQVLYYVRADLANTNKRLSNVLNFVKNTAPFVTFIKSASYVLHDRIASETKDFIMKNANAILQDDTGIPFRYFDSSWNKFAFGEYDGPISIFKTYVQNDLKKFFSETREIAKIPFTVGWYRSKPNLMLLVSTIIHEEVKKPNLPPVEAKFIIAGSGKNDVQSPHRHVEHSKKTGGGGCPCKNKKKKNDGKNPDNQQKIDALQLANWQINNNNLQAFSNYSSMLPIIPYSSNLPLMFEMPR